MKITFVVLGLFLTFPFVLPAQDTVTLTLERAQQQALDNSANYRRQLLDEDVQSARLREARARLLPQVTAAVDVRYNIQLPTTIVPGEAFGRPDERTVALQFGTRWNNLANLEVDQILYDGQVLQDLNLLQLDRRLSELDAEVTAADVRLEATRQYLNVLLSRAQVAELAASAARQENTIAEVQARVDGGRLNAIELDRVRTDYAVTQSNLTRARQAQALAETQLRITLALPETTPLILTDTLPGQLPDPAPVAADQLIPTLPDYRRQALQINIAEDEWTRQRRAALPTLSLYGLAGAQAFGDRLNYFNTKVLPWYGQLYVGLRAKWNVNRMFDNDIPLERLRLRQRQAEHDLRQQTDQLRLAVETARTTLLQAREEVRIQEQRRAFADRERQYLDTRFRGDLATAKELVDAERALQLSERATLVAYVNYLLAYYDYLHTIGGL